MLLDRSSFTIFKNQYCQDAKLWLWKKEDTICELCIDLKESFSFVVSIPNNLLIALATWKKPHNILPLGTSYCINTSIVNRPVKNNQILMQQGHSFDGSVLCNCVQRMTYKGCTFLHYLAVYWNSFPDRSSSCPNSCSCCSNSNICWIRSVRKCQNKSVHPQ